MEQARPLLGWSDLEELSEHDIEIGSHGCRHLELDVVPLQIARGVIERSRRESAPPSRRQPVSAIPSATTAHAFATSSPVQATRQPARSDVGSTPQLPYCLVA